MTEKYEVRFAIDVRASSPEQAAAIARDMLLDSDTELHADVHEYEYYEPAEDWFPRVDRGVLVYFGDIWPRHYLLGGDIKKYAGSGVRPIESVAYSRSPAPEKGGS